MQPERAALARLVCELLAMAGVLWLGWAERSSGGSSGAGGEEWLRQLRRQLLGGGALALLGALAAACCYLTAAGVPGSHTQVRAS